MNTREMTKWQPFNALSPGSIMVNNVLKEKYKIKMPELSDEQILGFENLIIESYTNKENILLIIFKNGVLFKKKGIVKNINRITSKITFDDESYIFFKQILNIKKN